MNQAHSNADYWYENRHELEEGMVFRTRDGSIVRLDHSVPGDGTKWYVNDWTGVWSYYDNTIEPGDLTGYPIKDDPSSITKAQEA